jgi:hypothetical protein
VGLKVWEQRNVACDLVLNVLKEFTTSKETGDMITKMRTKKDFKNIQEPRILGVLTHGMDVRVSAPSPSLGVSLNGSLHSTIEAASGWSLQSLITGNNNKDENLIPGGQFICAFYICVYIYI